MKDGAWGRRITSAMGAAGKPRAVMAGAGVLLLS